MGEQGVQLWNADRLRTPGERKLDGVDLAGCELANANLADCSLNHVNFANARLPDANFAHSSLRYANFRGAVLYGANFDRADLAGARLGSAHLEGSSFKFARLLNARLSNATLRWCDFRNADLRNANLQGAALEPCNLGQADLTGAQFSSEALREFEASVARLESAGEHPRAIFFALLGASAFSAVTALGASDLSLIVGTGQIKVPLLDTELSPAAFFFAAPTVCTALMLYVATHVRQLRRAAKELPAYFWDGVALAGKLSPWLQIAAPSGVKRRAVLEDGSDESWGGPVLSRGLLTLATHWLVPILTTLMFITYARSRNMVELRWLGLLTASIWIAAYASWRPMRRDARALRAHALFLAALALGLGGAWWAGMDWMPPLQARSAELQGKSLSSVQLQRAQMSFAKLERSVLRDVDLSGALLLNANFTQSGGRGLVVHRARLTKANFSQSFFAKSNFSEAQLVEVDFRGAELRGTTFLRADLRGADLRGALLKCVDLRGANLASAELEGARFEHLRCDAQTVFPSTQEGRQVRTACRPSIEGECGTSR